jgi:3-methyladenine DNA glycosylase AlkD
MRALSLEKGMGSKADPTLIAQLRQTLAAHAEPANAEPMRAYMKSVLPFLGIAAPKRRALVAAVVKAHPLADTAALADTMLALWQAARFREERYTAMELARVKPHPRCVGLALLPVYETMIVSGAWWDFCDDISGEGLRVLLERFAHEVKPVLRRWARGGDLWLRRAAMLCQRRLRERVDAVLLYDTILPSIGSGRYADEYFIRKGIGWALRERSYQAPEEVAEFCRQYAAQLAPLTVREALKVIRRSASAPPRGGSPIRRSASRAGGSASPPSPSCGTGS